MPYIVVGMSGGVDSSVAAALLVQAGYEVVGITLRTAPWTEPEDESGRFGACCSPATASGARAVARHLGIPYYLLNHEREFAALVIDDFTREYRRGRTPSPCVVCNREVKFGTLLSRALAWEADGVATGHYARLVREPGRRGVRLCRALDRQKDQSYFLWPLSQAQLERAYFPIGELTKAEVRARARALGLATAETPESQELCFVRGDYRAFLRDRAPEAFQAGPILDGETGREVGVHAGLGAYTIGQRKGLGAADGRRYVIGLDPERNAVLVGPREALDATGLEAQGVNWISGAPPAEPVHAEARIRHNAPLVPARVEPTGSDRVTVRFASPQRAVTPGQSVVFYRGEDVLGGGVIERAA